MTYRSRGRSVLEVIIVSANLAVATLKEFPVFSLFIEIIELPLYFALRRLVLAIDRPHSHIQCSCLSFFERQRARQAVCFTGFLVGFITVLCIGNYFRAKRAQERQRQRRLAKLTSSSRGAGGEASPVNDGSYDPPSGIGGGVHA